MTIDIILNKTVPKDELHEMICELIQITEPGAYALREPDGRLMVWATPEDSENDDGSRAIYRSQLPISDAAWDEVKQLTWVEFTEES